MTESFTSINDIFPTLPGQLESNRESELTQGWVAALHGVVRELARRDGFLEATTGQIHEAIDNWVVHPDHGAQHSYHVYEGMKWMASEEGWLGEVSDSVLQAMAVLHDLMQTVPLVDPKTGSAFVGNQRKLHAKAMATAVGYYGQRLGLPEEEITDLAFNIRHHDDVYEGIGDRPFSYAGQLLSDADKLFGSGLSRNPKELARGAMLRNLKGSSGLQGWYLLRGDIGEDERREWNYGDRWLVDAVASVKVDIFRLPFYTATGRQLGEARKKAFLELVERVYGDEYDRAVDALKVWRDLESQGDETTVFLVGKDQSPELVEKGIPIDQVVAKAHQRTLPLKQQYLRDGLEPRGWKILFSDFVIDPTIARFAFSAQGKFESEEGRRTFINELMDAFRVENKAEYA